MRLWLPITLVLCAGWLTLTAQSCWAIVVPALPEVPATSPAVDATTTLATNSPATQTLIDQLFDKADYENFADRSSSTSFMNGVDDGY